MVSEYKVKLMRLAAFNVTLFVIIIMITAFIVNTYVSNQHSHSKAVAFEVVKGNYSHYPHVLTVSLSSFKIVRGTFSKINKIFSSL